MKRAGSPKISSETASGTTKAKMNIIRAKVPADKTSVTLEMMPGSGARGQITLTPHGLALLVGTLGRVHASMVEGQPIPPFDMQGIEAVYDPRWQVSPGLMGEAAAFAFHHPGFGPLGFLVPIAQVETMIAALSHQVAAVAAAKTSVKN